MFFSNTLIHYTIAQILTGKKVLKIIANSIRECWFWLGKKLFKWNFVYRLQTPNIPNLNFFFSNAYEFTFASSFSCMNSKVFGAGGNCTLNVALLSHVAKYNNKQILTVWVIQILLFITMPVRRIQFVNCLNQFEPIKNCATHFIRWTQIKMQIEWMQAKDYHDLSIKWHQN